MKSNWAGVKRSEFCSVCAGSSHWQPEWWHLELRTGNRHKCSFSASNESEALRPIKVVVNMWQHSVFGQLMEEKSKSAKMSCCSAVRMQGVCGGVRTGLRRVNSSSKLLTSFSALMTGRKGGFSFLASRALQSIPCPRTHSQLTAIIQHLHSCHLCNGTFKLSLDWDSSISDSIYHMSFFNLVYLQWIVFSRSTLRTAL